jgi:hypothetical protein
VILFITKAMKKNLFIVIATLWFAAQQVFATSELRNFMTHPKDVPMIRLSEDWEGDGLGWTFVNGTQTNQWIVGTATSNGVGSKSVYISNDGSSNQYTITSTSVVHFYQDVSFPASMESYDLYFDLKTVGEWIGTTTHYDFLEVRIVDTNVTPQAGTRLEEGTQIGMYSNRPTWQTIHETLLSSLSGTTKRLVFTWRNDHQGGAQPPAAVDNIKLEARSYITDAALTEIFFPFRVHETGVKEVKVRLQNHGLPITSGTIRWSVNGATQTPFQWSGNLNYCEQEMVILGSFNFPHGTHTISATVEIMGDANPVNNTVNKTIVFETVTAS